MHEEETLLFDVVGIGNPVYDIIVTPWAKTDGRVLSGCSINACLAAKRLGVKKVGLVGCIGQDFARRFSRDIDSYGVEATMDTTGKQTGGFHLIYNENGNRTLDILGVANKITVENFPEKFLDSRFFLIGPILGEIDLELIEYIRSSSSGKLFLDPQGIIRVVGDDKRVIHRCNMSVFEKISRLVDFIKPNEHESETITNEKDPVLALKRLRELGAPVPIVTLGERGSLVLDGETLYRIPAYVTRAIDPTGAGDVYAGSFIMEYMRGGNLVEAALFASAAASIKVEQVGPNFRMSLKNVRERREGIRGRLITESLAQ